MDLQAALPWIIGLGVGGFAMLGLLVFTPGRGAKLDARLKGLDTKPVALEAGANTVARMARKALPKVGNVLVPDNEEQRSLLQSRLIHAGLYSRQAMPVFLGVKMSLMVGPLLLGIGVGLAGLVPLFYGAMGGMYLTTIGLFGPGYWLNARKAKRQCQARRGLPDVLDVLVICIEGGLTLNSALSRVSTGLRAVHPLLSTELDISLREIQLGRTTGEALRNISDRLDLEEMRSLSSVIIQAERFGAGLARSLRVHGETLRLRRQQRAEEMAQKASTKILVPTLLFIFPSIFVVVLGPAVIQIMETLMTDK